MARKRVSASKSRQSYIGAFNRGSNGHSRSLDGDLESIVFNEEMKELTENALLSRDNFIGSLLSRGRRDYNTECDLPNDPVPLQVYDELHRRNPYAARVDDAEAEECWDAQPAVFEDEDPKVETAFEGSFNEMCEGLQTEDGIKSYFESQEDESNPLWYWMERLDKESGKGRYGIMLYGYDDVKGDRGLEKPVTYKKGRKLLYIRVFPEIMAQISSLDNNPSSARYGQPEYYQLSFVDVKSNNALNLTSITGASVSSVRVHWSRVQHYSEDISISPLFSPPRQEGVLNNLLGITKIMLGDPESYWNCGFPSYTVKSDPKLAGSFKVNKNRMRDDLEKWKESLKRILILHGFSLETVAPTVNDPSPHIEIQVEAICVKKSMPKRILLGSERGELSSSQDSKRWEARKRGKRKKVLTPRMIVPFINRQIAVGVLVPPKKRYYCVWPTDEHLTDSEKAAVFVQKMQGLSVAASGGVAGTLLTDDRILQEAGWSEEDAQSIMDDLKKEEEKQQEQHQQIADEHGFQKAPPEGFTFPPQPDPKGGNPKDKGQRRKNLDLSHSQNWELQLLDMVHNAFCPTGAGGGVDPSCSPGGGTGQGVDKSNLKGSGTKEDPYRCGKDIKLAAKLLSEGQHIRLKQPDQVSTLLERMHKMVWESVDKGEKAPKFDLCKVSVKDTNLFCQDNLDIPRIQMPQMKGQAVPGSKAHAMGVDKKGEVDLSAAFIDHLKGKGIATEETSIRASHLRASQNEIVGSKISKMVMEARAGTRDLREKPIFVTQDNYVVDGHHHWAAIVGLGYSKGKDLKVPVYRLKMDIGQALTAANDYTREMGIAPKSATANVFCPTGVGGGIDPSCGAGAGGAGGHHPPGAGLAHTGEGLEHISHSPLGHELGQFSHAMAAVGSTASTMGSAVAALKLMGVKVEHAEHVVKSYVADKIERAVSKLPGPIQATVRGAFVAGKVGLQAAFVTYTASQAFAEKVAVERGYSKEEARRLRGVLSTIDVAAAKPVVITLGAAASFAPVGSLSYLAYSTAKDPMATFRAAKNLIVDTSKSIGAKLDEKLIKSGLKLGPAMNADDGEVRLNLLVSALEDHDFSDWYIALLSAATDGTDDLQTAVETANAAYEKSQEGAA